VEDKAGDNGRKDLAYFNTGVPSIVIKEMYDSCINF
jgi:hypothetical protein